MLTDKFGFYPLVSLEQPKSSSEDIMSSNTRSRNPCMKWWQTYNADFIKVSLYGTRGPNIAYSG